MKEDLNPYYIPSPDECEDITDKPKIITISGNNVEPEEIIKAYNRLTLEGNVVLISGLIHGDERDIPDDFDSFNADYSDIEKIKMCDEVHVINKDKVISLSMFYDISYAHDIGKEITYMEPLWTPPEKESIFKVALNYAKGILKKLTSKDI